MTIIRKAALCLATIVAAAGCADRTTAPNPPVPPPPVPPPPSGSAVVNLSTPHSDDGALVVILRGPILMESLYSLQPSSPGYYLYWWVPKEGEARVTLVGDLAGGALFQFKLKGTNPSSLTATVQQVATRSDALRADVRGYQATVSAAP
jgi:hypothetical protein